VTELNHPHCTLKWLAVIPINSVSIRVHDANWKVEFYVTILGNGHVRSSGFSQKL